MPKPMCRVVVYDLHNAPLPRATVTLEGRGQTKVRIPLPTATSPGVYEADVPAPGLYTLVVAAPGLEPESRELDVDRTGFRETFILGKKGLPAFFRGRVRVPFEPKDDLVAVALEDAASDPKHQDARGSQGMDARFEALCKKLKLEEVPAPEAVTKDRIRLLRLTGRLTAERRRDVQRHLSALPGVRRVGAIVRLDRESVSFLTDQVIVRFKPRKSDKDMQALAAKHGLTLVRAFTQSPRTFLATTKDVTGYDQLVALEALRRTGEVEYVEPDLLSSVVDDAITPGDNLFANQWHHPIVRTPDAWQALAASLGAAQAFGSPGIIVAVMDSGVDPAHPDLSGSVSSGQPKVFASYDFANMVANNNSLAGNHGTSCAGIATARADNPGSSPGTWEGVAGAAGNCRLMGLRRSGPESRYADAYMWAAGFNVTTAGFPAQLGQGADVITNSFGVSIGMPISGLMADTFDYLTDHGRGGKGTILLFSIGNYVPPEDFTLLRPWAAYERTLAIAASSLGNDGVTEIIADYSNFSPAYGTGGIIDVCAPSHDSYVGGSPLHNPPANYATITTDITGQGNLAGPGGNLDYHDGFGGTSSATPLVAGIAALVLSANSALSWQEVRKILRDTATKIDFGATDPLLAYADIDGNGTKEYSRKYGFGRVDAAAAVAAASKAWVFDVHPKHRFPEKYLTPEKRFKERFAEVKLGSYDKDWVENPFGPFEEIFDPTWRLALEKRLTAIEAKLEGRAFIRADERPPVGEAIRSRKRRPST